MGNSDETVCAENNLINYHAGFATIGDRSTMKFVSFLRSFKSNFSYPFSDVSQMPGRVLELL